MSEEEIREDERHQCWREINAMIVVCKDRDLRNGMILAANRLMDLPETTVNGEVSA